MSEFIFTFTSLDEIRERMTPAQFHAFKRWMEFEYEIPIHEIAIDLLSHHAHEFLTFQPTVGV